MKELKEIKNILLEIKKRKTPKKTPEEKLEEKQKVSEYVKAILDILKKSTEYLDRVEIERNLPSNIVKELENRKNKDYFSIAYDKVSQRTNVKKSSFGIMLLKTWQKKDDDLKKEMEKSISYIQSTFEKETELDGLGYKKIRHDFLKKFPNVGLLNALKVMEKEGLGRFEKRELSEWFILLK